MAIAYPDISSYEAGLKIQPGTVAVVAKATEGTYYKDKYYEDFKAQAAAVGAIFSGYHFLIAGEDPVLQAKAYYAKAGKTPCMLDVETTGNSKPGVDLVVAFIQALKGLGGRVWGVYFPKWYWEEIGGDLSRLTRAGAVLVSSNYTTYSDGGPGWEPYGGATPAVWQWTNALSYGGQSVDFNAFKGTVAELAKLINGAPAPVQEEIDMDPSTPLTFPSYVPSWYPDIAKDGGQWTGQQSFNDVLTLTAARVGHLVHQCEKLQASLDAAASAIAKLSVSAGVDPVAVADAELAEIKAKL